MKLYTMEFEIPLVCLLLILLLVFVYYSKPNIDLPQNKAFRVMILASLAEIFLDFLVHLICSFNSFDVIISPSFYALFNIMNKFIVIFFVMIFECLFFYVIIITYGKGILKNRKLIIPIAGINLVALISLMFTKIQIVDAKTAANVTGSTPMLGYVMIAIFLTGSLIVTLKNIKKIDKRYLPIIVVFVVLGVCYVVTLFFSGIILYDFAILILCYLMFFTLENPDMNMLEEMHEAKMISDHSNEEKTLFLYNMTQEIRDTTNKINYEADNILESDSIDDNKDSARNIKGETAKFTTMTNDIFDVSKIDAANIKVYNSKYNIKIILKEIVSMYTSKCSAKGINFRTNIEHNIPSYLYGDSIGLKKVIVRILEYSLGCTNKGSIELNINTVIKNDICRLIISIEDTSLGIPADEIEKIKLENKNLDEAYKTTILMNGAMMILPNYGVGNKFKIILDQRMEQVESKDLKQYNEIYDNKKILVVDDSEASIKIIEKLLKNSKIVIESVNSGKEAINKLKVKNKYDLILLDEELTQITGVELLAKFKDIRNFNIPVILMSKDSNYEYNQEYINQGFDDWIIKPLKKDNLMNKLDKFMGE